MVDREKPWFVKITGRGRYQIKPYGRGGWMLMGFWLLMHALILSLLSVDAIRERAWIILVLDALVTIPLVVVAIRIAVPIEQLRNDKA